MGQHLHFFFQPLQGKLDTVSYTHLDVYKRQVVCHDRVATGFVNTIDGHVVIPPLMSPAGIAALTVSPGTVSYTHLDVYKRQVPALLLQREENLPQCRR